MRIPAHIIKEKRRREEVRRRRDEAARIPLDQQVPQEGPKGEREKPRGEKKRPVAIFIEL